MGHGGTLDPLATGVLILGIGSGTKWLQNFLGCTKTYETTILFGAATDSYDTLGKVVARKPHAHVTKERVQQAIQTLQARKTQRPPIFSALRFEGKRFYEYAREGKELPIEIPERPAEIHDIELLDWLTGDRQPHRIPEEEADEAERAVAAKVLDAGKASAEMPPTREPDQAKSKAGFEGTMDGAVEERNAAEGGQDESLLMSGALREMPPHSGEQKSEGVHSGQVQIPPACRIRMTVSTGFYIRSFAHDLGQEVGSFALMATLARTRQEQFELGKNVLNWDEVDKVDEESWAPRLESLLDDWEKRPKPSRDATPPRYEGNQQGSKKRDHGQSRDARPNKKSRGSTAEGFGDRAAGRRRRNSSSEDDT